ncbi:uncharacterized protein LOC115716583 [Cannabis sativa]|uniref:uncharacterized protein LOC115716583 n=1 Tax=Cannabis sativa TaxID=3483 RepID=UPI0029C9F76A|nr:uncharacterized protein LOC115716583 [Cannabis sativa]
MSTLLPRFVVLKSMWNGKYLRKMSKDESNEKGMNATFLKFEGEDITSPLVKFAVEIAQRNREFVHLRSCHNNKYLTIEPNNSLMRIVAGADEPIEDLDSLSCTMFKPIQANGSNEIITYEELRFGFFHASTNSYACQTESASKPYASGMFVGYKILSKDLFPCSLFKVLDWDSLVIFPKKVLFKMVGHEKYLSLRQIQRRPYLQFVGYDNGDNTTEYEISTFGDGYVRIKSLSNNKFWRRSPNWIWADSDDESGNNKNTLFRPIRVADNVVAFQNMGNNNFCKSLTTEGKTNCLNAAMPNITIDSKLEILERVLERSIYNINFRQDESRVYDLKVMDLVPKATAANYTNEENTLALNFSYKITKSSTFSGNASLKLGVKTTFETAVIPLIAKGSVEISGEVTIGLQWGNTTSIETVTETTYTARVPAMTRVTVTLIATQGKCDVPFSYVQRDSLYKGGIRVTKMDDGMFKGINMFDFRFDSHYEKLVVP